MARKPVTFPPTQEADILARYEAGQSTKTIADAVGRSRTPVEGVLRSHGVYEGQARARRLSPEQERDAVNRYMDGESARSIALSFGFASGKGVERILREHGVYEKRFSGFTPGQEQRLVSRYCGGASANTLAKEHGVSHKAVVGVLQRHGVYTPRRFSKFTETDYDAIVARHRDGVPIGEIASAFGCAEGTVYVVLRRRGVQVVSDDPLERIGKRYSMDEKREMIAQYESGDSIYRIAQRFGGPPQSVWKVLRAGGVAFRDNAWQGGRVDEYGGTYIGVYIAKDDPLICMARSTGYVLEHRLVMARKLGRPLTSKETVHHINGDTRDNRPENLQLRNGNHGKGAKFTCLDCGSHNVAASPL